MDTQTVQLTRDGLRIPRIVFGTSCLGNLYRALPDATKLALARNWFAAVGVPAVDSAGKYGAGLSLECIGRALRELGVPRDKIVISNKLGWRRMPLEPGTEPTFEPGVWAGLSHDARQDITYQGILDCYAEGRDLLGHGYDFSMLSVHDPDEYLANKTPEARKAAKQNILDAYRALFELKAAGETRAVGIGAKDYRVVMELYTDVRFDYVMFACAPTVLRHPPELLAFMEKLRADGVGIINSAVFNAGFLTGGSIFDYREITEEEEPELFRRRDQYLARCREFNLDPAAPAVEFGMRLPGVAATALNTSNPARIAPNAESCAHRSPDAFWRALRNDGVIGVDVC